MINLVNQAGKSIYLIVVQSHPVLVKILILTILNANYSQISQNLSTWVIELVIDMYTVLGQMGGLLGIWDWNFGRFSIKQMTALWPAS
jgi:hypothetical protein